MSKRNGGPAFPRPISWDESPVSGTTSGNSPTDRPAQDGMSLHDWFAGQALAMFSGEDLTPNDAAISAYAIADAMIEERKRLIEQ